MVRIVISFTIHDPTTQATGTHRIQHSEMATNKLTNNNIREKAEKCSGKCEQIVIQSQAKIYFILILSVVFASPRFFDNHRTSDEEL